MRDGRWDRFFDDLEHQFAAELESERDELDAESERVRIARLALRDRLAAAGVGAHVTIEAGGMDALRIAIAAVGRDWVAGSLREGMGLIVVPTGSIDGLAFASVDLARSTAAVREDPLTARIAFGFVLRSMARRRVPVTVIRRRSAHLGGTLQRVGADHLDIATHDAGAAPRADDVRSVRTVAFDAVAGVRVTRDRDLGVI